MPGNPDGYKVFESMAILLTEGPVEALSYALLFYIKFFKEHHIIVPNKAKFMEVASAMWDSYERNIETKTLDYCENCSLPKSPTENPCNACGHFMLRRRKD